ncbi:MAG: glycosyltransferase family 4 protein [Candidatus Doudnabacteria bacterium]|nr:glycosyltransferase family 4 protein [Candidatus Doudnabacteria bacterium]
MKICVVAYKFGTEKELGEHLGTYHYFIQKLRETVKAGVEVYVVCPWLSVFHKGSNDIDGIKVVRYWSYLKSPFWFWPVNRWLRWFYMIRTQSMVQTVLRSSNFSAVYVWQSREAGYAIAQIKDRLNAPFIFRQITAWLWHFERSAEETFGKRKWYQQLQDLGLKTTVDYVLGFVLDNKTQKKYARLIYNRADKLVFLSQAAAREGKLLGAESVKIRILGVAIETDLFRPLSDKAGFRTRLKLKGEKIVLFIGRINFAEKGLDYLLRAMPEIVTALPGVNLVIVGSGQDSDRMRSMIQELRLDGCVQTVGKRSFAELVDYLNAADVLVIPSIWMEAFGQVTIEGMACGVPVVTSDAGAGPEINIDGQTGFVVPAKNSPGIVQTVVRILRDPALQKRLGQQARTRVIQNYSYPVIVSKFLKLLHD